VDASEQVRDEIRRLAASVLSTGAAVAPESLEVRDGWVSVPDNGHRVAVREVVAGLTEPIVGTSDRRRVLTSESVATGAHAVEIEVDTKLGHIRILRYVAVHDVGKVLSRLMLEQQVEGGVGMGLGGALYEELLIDERTGLPVNANILDYKPMAFGEVPPIIVDFVEVPQDYGPYGALAIGQASTPPVGPVLANAFHNATGVWLTDLPLSRARVLAALGTAD
jgi:xanthine dehydrogenase molybdenum-binding subunit